MHRSLVALSALVNLRRVYCLRASCKVVGLLDLMHVRNTHVSNEGISKEVVPADMLSEKLKGAQNGNYINDLLLENSSSLTTTHLLIALNTLAEKIRNDPNSDLLETPHLQFLCTHLLKKVRSFELSHVVAILGNLTFLKVPSDTVVMQTFLQVLRLHINDLNFEQIQWLTAVLKKMHSTPLVEALKVALPLVVYNQLDLQMDKHDPIMLAKLFSYGCRHQFHVKDIAKIERALLNLSEKWSSKDAMNVLWGAVYLKSHWHEFGELVSTALDVVRKSMSEIPKDALLQLLPYLQMTNISSEPLFRAIGHKAFLERWELRSMHKLLLLITNASILDADLLNFYASALENDLLNGTTQMPMNEIVMVFAKPNFSPANVDTLLKEFMKHTEVMQANPAALVKYVLNLIVLGAVPTEVSTLLRGTGCNLLQHQNTADPWFLKDVALLRAIVDCEHWKDSLDIERVEMLHEDLRNTEPAKFPLLWALQKGFPNHVIHNGVVTRSGIYIDHLLLQSNHLDADSFPVSADDSKRLPVVDKVNLSTTSKKVAILVNTADNYARNTYHINGERALAVCALKKAGYIVVQICLDQWNELFHRECVPYLVRAIQKQVFVNSTLD